ncbi:Cu-binding protein [Bachmanniomyces sp. S44760]|nr:Cu-binding protein [Bachmanniomyces sp. S44760]
MATMIDLVNASSSSSSSSSASISPSSSLSSSASTPPISTTSPAILPIFITCDPARDTPQVLKTYLSEFHPAMVGLTGSWEDIKRVCKLYRVYFSTPEGVKPGMDYLVDHSIYIYLMDPEGDFVEAIGRQHSAERAAKIINEHINDWKGKGKGIRSV